MTRARERAIKMYWKMAKEKCPFQTEELVNGYLEGFIDCAELFEEEDKLTLTKYARIIIDKKDECIEELEKENAELKSDNDARKFAMAMSEKVEKQLREQLTKAKELLTKWVELFKPKGGNIPPIPIQVDTEQFLKEIEK